MLKLSASQLALTAILGLVLVLVVGVLSTQASVNRQGSHAAPNAPGAVQAAPPPVGTYPPPMPSYPPPIPSHYPPPAATAKPTREPRPSATPHPWLRYAELIPADHR